MNYIQQYIELIDSYPFVIRVAMYFILFNIIVTILFMGITMLLRRKFRLNNERLDKLKPQHIDFLKDIFQQESNPSVEEIAERYQEKFGKQNHKNYPALIAALEQMVVVRPDLLDHPRYETVLSALRVEEYLGKSVRSTEVRKRLSTFHSLSILGLSAPDSSILPYAHSKNQMLKREARNTYVGISNHDPFKFFNKTDGDFNQWDEINLMSQIEQHHKDNLPNFSTWIKYSKNKSHLIFIVKAVAHFKQYSSVPSIIDLLDYEDEDVRLEAINALGQMQIHDAEPKLMQDYVNQTVVCQDAIIEAMSQIKSGKALHFMEEAFHATTNLESKKLIAEAIYRYSPEGQHFINGLYNHEDAFTRLVLDHIKNPLIPSKLKGDLYSKIDVKEPLEINLANNVELSTNQQY